MPGAAWQVIVTLKARTVFVCQTLIEIKTTVRKKRMNNNHDSNSNHHHQQQQQQKQTNKQIIVIAITIIIIIIKGIGIATVIALIVAITHCSFLLHWPEQW